VDVAPTLLGSAGIPSPAEVQGQSLLNTIIPARNSTVSGNSELRSRSNTTVTERPVYSESDYSHRAFGWHSLRSVRTGKYLFVEAPTRELYDQAADPKAAHNLAAASPAVSDTLSAQVEDAHRQYRNPRPGAANASASATIDAQQAEQLNALGYVSSGSSASESTKEEGADPKDKIEIANLLHDSLLEVEDGRYQEAVLQLKRVLAQEPDMTVAQMQLGIAFARLKKPDQALPLLKSAVARQPDSGMGHYELGLALFDTGDLQGAAPEFEFAVAHAPRWADAHFSLAAVQARIDRVPEALTELNIALDLNREHYRANLLRGRILSLQGRAIDALSNLEKAAQVEPRSVEAHQFLAEAYSQAGQPDAAQREQAAADNLKAARP
jgi:tetratricopeptide (TPR) repeat protein